VLPLISAIPEIVISSHKCVQVCKIFIQLNHLHLQVPPILLITHVMYFKIIVQFAMQVNPEH
jgi:hypothetical protein